MKGESMTCPIKPLGNNVVVKRDEVEKETAGGIILPDQAQDRPTKGTVLRVGIGRPDKNGKPVLIELKEGDVVAFPQYAGVDIEDKGEKYTIMDIHEIHGVVE